MTTPSSIATVQRRLGTLAVAFAVGFGTVLAGAAQAGAARGPTEVVDRLVDVGGYGLYLRCTGRGSPTVVMDASLGADTSTWSNVEPVLSRVTRVCVYDRAGLGRSDDGPFPRTSQTLVDELKTLLRNAEVQGPYVFVAHSIAGLHVQLFARQDGGRSVAGVVLIDTTPAGFVAVLDSLGLQFPPPDDPIENPEGLDIRGSADEVLTAPPFPAVPLVVLTHGVSFGPPLEQPWQELQAAQAEFSPFGRLVVAKRSGHYIQNDEPQLVVRTVIEVVADARRNLRLGA